MAKPDDARPGLARKLKRALAILLLLVVAGYAARTWWNVTHIHGMILALEPVGNGRAIVCMRANAEYGQKPRAWIGLYDARRDAWVWSQRLTGLPSGGFRTGAVRVHEGRAIVRAVRSDDDDRDSLVSSYSLDDGKRQWESTLKGMRNAASSFDIVAAGTAVLVTSGDARKLAALELASGSVRWSRELDVLLQNPRVSADGTTLVLFAPGNATAVDLKSGADRSLPSVGCVDKERYVRLEQDSEGARIVADSFTDKSHRVLADVTLPPSWKLAQSADCARYADRFVFFISRNEDRELGMLSFAEVPSDARFFALGFKTADFSLEHTIPGTALSPDSSAPRFALLRGDDSLAELDLREGRIVRRSAPLELHFADRLFYDAKGTYAVFRDDGYDLTITRVDGTDGHVSAAACADKNVEDPLPFHLGGDGLWLHSTRWISGEPQLSILDAKTLAPSGANRLHIRDCSEQTRLRLKL